MGWNSKFDKHPHLAHLVTHLEVSGMEFFSESESDDEDEDRWDATLGSDAAALLMSRLPNVADLSLEEFSDWGPKEQAAILRLPSAQLRSLKIANVPLEAEDLLQLVNSMTQVHSLSITSVYLETFSYHLQSLFGASTLPTTPERGISPSPPRHLRALTLDELQYQPDLLRWLTGPNFDLTRLKQAELCWAACTKSESSIKAPHHFPSFVELARVIGPSVTDLVLRRQGQSSMDDHDFCLSVFFHLLVADSSN